MLAQGPLLCFNTWCRDLPQAGWPSRPARCSKALELTQHVLHSLAFHTQEITKLGGRIETSSPARHISQTNSSVDVYSDSGIYGAK